MKLLNWLFTFLFLLFAYFQYNDPDPWLWIGLYVFIALISGMASFGIYKKWLIGLGIGICLAGLLLLLPDFIEWIQGCLLYTSPSPRDLSTSRMPSSA